jgi:hypothetical protein
LPIVPSPKRARLRAHVRVAVLSIQVRAVGAGRGCPGNRINDRRGGRGLFSAGTGQPAVVRKFRHFE